MATIDFHRECGIDLADDLLRAFDPRDVIQIGHEFVAKRCLHLQKHFDMALWQSEANTALWQAEMRASFWARVAQRISEQPAD